MCKCLLSQGLDLTYPISDQRKVDGCGDSMAGEVLEHQGKGLMVGAWAVGSTTSRRTVSKNSGITGNV